ncbi:pentatricopeptide repeat-containing protein At2g34400-like [Selaginella moellendorffii]|uniref:pentatricopeptide repeat-containing protein At2g34400-like n=1 Tax=Selaginella moellendorffii TaxID=88036 RepID=UPI000D1C9285|nr:pentatricopeptide repeat-containing protein At2g34400-like [Selaginella moellendorffii]|eukprot:XP_024541829.1 pentatricopeptide repeat-containing protein At2g34400-like [Selaginella moellendorffii]
MNHTWLNTVEKYVQEVRLCRDNRLLESGKKLHAALATNTLLASDRYLNNHLIDMYCKCGSLSDAREVFDKMPSKNLFSWTMIISAYTDDLHGGLLHTEAVELFHWMLLEGLKPRDSFVFTALLGSCAQVGDCRTGSWIHSSFLTGRFFRDVVVGTALINMYGKCGAVRDAFIVFQHMEHKNSFSRNAMIDAFCRSGGVREGLDVFRGMQLEGARPDSITFVLLLDALSGDPEAKVIYHGKALHKLMLSCDFFVASNVVLATSLMNMYGKLGFLEDCKNLFDWMSVKTVVTWNVILSAYAQRGHIKSCKVLLHTMELEGVKPDEVTFTTLTGTCSDVLALRSLHQRISMDDLLTVRVSNALITMYGRLEDVVSARRVFDGNLEKDRVSWNALIAAYARNGHGTLAFQMYRLMNLEAYRPNLVTFVCVLRACTCIEEGRTIHRHVAESKLVSDTMVGTALVTMYGSCGSLNDAVGIFESSIVKNEITWTSILVVSAQHHHHHDVLELYSAMVLDGIDPNHVTFVALLFSCCHHGLPSEALSFYRSMTPDHGIEPNLFHLACVFDTLAREGFITDVIKDYLDLSSKRLRDCSKECNDVLWTSLLSGCTIHGDKYNAKQAARSALRSNAKNSAAYSFALKDFCNSNLAFSAGSNWMLSVTCYGDAIAKLLREKLLALLTQKPVMELRGQSARSAPHTIPEALRINPGAERCPLAVEARQARGRAPRPYRRGGGQGRPDVYAMYLLKESGLLSDAAIASLANRENRQAIPKVMLRNKRWCAFPLSIIEAMLREGSKDVGVALASKK